jgi:ubiquinone/menaquinone biosynthesis C-methylase UbiE
LDPEFEDRWRTRFEEFAELRDDDAGIAGWSTTGLDARVRRFLGLWTAGSPGQRWLDAGCGAGTYTRILSRHGLQVVGADYSLPTLRKTVSRNLDPAVFVVADVRQLPFRGEQFDGALCFGVTQALADSRAAVVELARQLRPGGELWCDALNSWCLVHVYERVVRRLRRRPIHLRHESPRRIKRIFREAGLIDVRLHWMPIVPSRSYGLQRVIEGRAAGWALSNVPMLAMLVSHAYIVRARKPS